MGGTNHVPIFAGEPGEMFMRPVDSTAAGSCTKTLLVFNAKIRRHGRDRVAHVVPGQLELLKKLADTLAVAKS